MVKILMGDVAEMLQRIPDNSVQTSITSPPYWGMRTYGVDGQIGHEATIGQYVDRLVTAFREIRRALREDGTFWLNIGDSFSTTDGAYGRSDPKSQKSNAYKLGQYYRTGKIEATSGLPPKNLVLVPYRLASALQADGWILRQDIIWAKTSALPEPTKDRPSSVHEHIFLFAKSQKYYYDKKASGTLARFADLLETDAKFQSSVWSCSSGSAGMNFCKKCLRTYFSEEYKRLASSDKKDGSHLGKQRHWKTGAEAPPLLNGRAPKICATCGSSDWEAHAAPYPEKLIAPCIMSSTSDKGCCMKCGTCWIREGKGWKKNCKCKTDEVRPCLVLDPFNGSGTTGVVSMRLGRNYVGMDLNPMYVGASYERMARIAKVRGMEF